MSVKKIMNKVINLFQTIRKIPPKLKAEVLNYSWKWVGGQTSPWYKFPKVKAVE
jgi:hypothetical protein